MSNASGRAWSKIFRDFNVLDHIQECGAFIIHANQIRPYREPRLMAKFDHTINLPNIFSQNQLAILPISRGRYIISHLEAYTRLGNPFIESSTRDINHLPLPHYIQTIDPTNITSESVAINAAIASGILSDFIDDDFMHPTVSGRMGSGQFEFSISSTKNNQKLSIEVDRAQIEIDAALEGIENLVLIEAKRDIFEDFIIRQLYFPYRTWEGQVRNKKVRPIFLVYANRVFRLYEYIFHDKKDYNSIELIRQKNYSIEETEINLQDIEELIESITVYGEPTIPFPQANNFERIINLCDLLNTSPLNYEEITSEYGFDVRQTSYYTTAGKYLGLIDFNPLYKEGRFSLTSKGKKIMTLPYKAQQLELCRAILEHKIFLTVFQKCLSQGCMPETTYIVEQMKKHDLYNINSEATYSRRASTIISWLHWIVGLWA